MSDIHLVAHGTIRAVARIDSSSIDFYNDTGNPYNLHNLQGRLHWQKQSSTLILFSDCVRCEVRKALTMLYASATFESVWDLSSRPLESWDFADRVALSDEDWVALALLMSGAA